MRREGKRKRIISILSTIRSSIPSSILSGSESSNVKTQMAEEPDAAATPIEPVLLAAVTDELPATKGVSESMAASLAFSQSCGTLLAMRSSTTFRCAHSALSDAS